MTAPPYQVSETGWGSFEIGIDIHVRGGGAPLRIAHVLKLYADSAASSSAPPGPDRPTLSETYDELVFNELPADAALRASLLRGPVADAPPYPYQEHLTLFSAENDAAAIKAARAWVRERMEEQEQRLVARQAEAAALRKHLGSLGIT